MPYPEVSQPADPGTPAGASPMVTPDSGEGGTHRADGLAN